MTDDFMQSPEFQALIKEYLEYLQQSLPGVRTNLQDELYQDVYKFGHNIKGTGTSYGFQELSDYGRDICEAVKAEEYSKLAGLLDVVGTVIDKGLAEQ